MKSSLVVNALNNAVAMSGGVASCVVHSDRGSQAIFNRSKRHLIVGRWMRVRDRQEQVRAYWGQAPSPGRPRVAWREDRVRFWPRS